jgi:dihydroflavonol-4-reductase
MPGAYTRSKLIAQQRALEAAASGLPVVIANRTMPIGITFRNLTPPALMLQYFISRRLQLYLDFVVNLVDVRDVAAGLLLAMQRGKGGQRYVLRGRKYHAEKTSRDCSSYKRPQGFAHSGFCWDCPNDRSDG